MKRSLGFLIKLPSKVAKMTLWSVSLFTPQDSICRILLYFTHEASSFISESYLEFKALNLISRICLLLRWYVQGFCLIGISIKTFAMNSFFTLWGLSAVYGLQMEFCSWTKWNTGLTSLQKQAVFAQKTRKYFSVIICN